jgi:hypothetical protein
MAYMLVTPQERVALGAATSGSVGKLQRWLNQWSAFLGIAGTIREDNQYGPSTDGRLKQVMQRQFGIPPAMINSGGPTAVAPIIAGAPGPLVLGDDGTDLGDPVVMSLGDFPAIQGAWTGWKTDTPAPPAPPVGDGPPPPPVREGLAWWAWALIGLGVGLTAYGGYRVWQAQEA